MVLQKQWMDVEDWKKSNRKLIAFIGCCFETIPKHHIEEGITTVTNNILRLFSLYRKNRYWTLQRGNLWNIKCNV